MASISASGGSLTFTPDSSSYFYETFPCQKATTNGYDVLSFSVRGPAGGTVGLELQTSTSCSETAHASYYYTLTGLTGSVQTVTLPLSSFIDANLDAIQGIVWFAFSSPGSSWQLADIELACSARVSSTISGTMCFNNEELE